MFLTKRRCNSFIYTKKNTLFNPYFLWSDCQDTIKCSIFIYGTMFNLCTSCIYIVAKSSIITVYFTK